MVTQPAAWRIAFVEGDAHICARHAQKYIEGKGTRPRPCPFRTWPCDSCVAAAHDAAPWVEVAAAIAAAGLTYEPTR